MVDPLFANERTRAAELYEQFAQLTATRLATRYRGVDPQKIADAVVEAILRMSREWDARANPARRLAELARQRLRSETRRRHRESMVEVFPPTELTAEQRELAEKIRTEVATDDRECTALELLLNGRSSPRDVAGVLRIDESEAASVLNRLRQRIHRWKVRVSRDD